jgi:hypothetical protein
MKEDLQSLIRRWHPEVPEPVAFRREVWSRIERGKHGRSVDALPPWLARPKIMSFAALIAILGGALVGSLAAGRGPDRIPSCRQSVCSGGAEMRRG